MKIQGRVLIKIIIVSRNIFQQNIKTWSALINEIELGMPVSALTKDVKMAIIMKPSVHYSISKEVDNEMLTIQHAYRRNHIT